MSKRNIIALIAVVAVGFGAFYAVSNGYVRFGAPAPMQVETEASRATEELLETSAAQSEELKELREQVDELSEALQKSEEDAASTPPVPASMMSVSSPVSSPESTVPPAAPASQAAATANTAPPAAPAKAENAGTVFEGYTVTVTDTKTPAEIAGGIDWPITKLYFFDANGDTLGSISGTAYNEIMDKYKIVNPVGGAWDAPGANGEWEFWFAEEYNAYRGLSNSSSGRTNSRPDGADTGGSSDIDINFDASGLASEAFDLVNVERVSADVGEVEMDSNMMELAEMRAEELAEKYDHERPNGTRMSTEYKYAEIINRRANTASIAVSSWMDSSGHKDIILKEKYNSAGIGCYKGGDGTVYWCMLFSK